MQPSHEHLSDRIGDAWHKLCEVYKSTKKLYLRAEELDPEFKSFMQPIGELRDANDHVMRAMAVRMGMDKPSGTDSVEDYVAESLAKALGHTYRCFFDTADWLSIALRERFLNEVDGFSNECLNAVWPEYYTKVRPQVTSVTAAIEIGAFRESKDVCKSNIINDVKKYTEIIETFVTHVTEAERLRPTLVAWSNKHEMTEKRKWIKHSLLGGVTFLLVAKAIEALISWPSK